ncbi:MAG: hypothetical protein ACYTG5_01655 [Planctomycetota bacterium]
MSSDQDKKVGTTQPVADERRGDARQPFEGEIRVRLLDPILVGPGENISGDGVFFVTEGSVQVEVSAGEDGKVYQGELVRLHSMGGGKTGVAVRFKVD